MKPVSKFVVVALALLSVTIAAQSVTVGPLGGRTAPLNMSSSSFPSSTAGSPTRIQTGTITIAAASLSNTATVTAFDIANSVVVFEGSTATGGGDADSWAILAVTNNTTLTATRGNTTGTVVVYFKVVEFAAGFLKSVQYFSVVHGNATTTNQAITSVNTAKTWLVPMGNKTTNAGPSLPSMLASWTLDNATQISVRTGINGNPNDVANVAVVETF